MGYEWQFTFDLKLLFGKKICPRCGNRMKKKIKKEDYTAADKCVIKENNRRHFVITFGEPKGYKGDLVLVCPNCNLMLDSDRYKIVKKIRKRTKQQLISEEELLYIIKYKTEKPQQVNDTDK